MNQSFYKNFDPSSLVSELREFSAVYKKRPIKKNAGGMLAPHSFATWFIVKQIQPEAIIESGVWKGQSTWILEQACPSAKIHSIDINLHYREYISKRSKYYDQDFLKIDWSCVDPKKTLLFFDDHQNAFERLQECIKLGFVHFIFEDNYPQGRGDCYSLKQAFAGVGHVDDNGKCTVKPNKEDAEFLNKNLEHYMEFPPIFKTSKTRWGDLWGEPSYATPDPLLSGCLDALKYRRFYKEANSYTWLCYAKAKEALENH